MVLVSFTVSAVILGIAISNLPFGFLADRLPILPIILTSGILVAVGGLVCAVTTEIWILIGARFLQGIFIPSLTTCLAAYLAKTLPVARLNVVMGSYVSATVLGGLCGRLLGGWIHPPLHWRYAFVSASALTLLATFTAVRGLPRASSETAQQHNSIALLELMKRWDLLRIYLCAAGGFAIFSSVFNYLPYRLAARPFVFSTERTTLLYLVYVVGIFIGPIAGRISNRFGSGNTLLAGSFVLGGVIGPYPVTFYNLSHIGTSWLLRRIFHYPCCCGWFSQPQTLERARTCKCPLRAVLLHGGLAWNYRFRICLQTRRLECSNIYFNVDLNYSNKRRHW